MKKFLALFSILFALASFFTLAKSLSASSHTNKESWYFYATIVPADKRGPFDTEQACKDAIKDVPDAQIPCTKDTSQTVNPGSPTASSSVKLLAPLPGLDKIKNPTLGEYLSVIYQIVLGLAGLLAVIMIIVGGVQYASTDAISNKELGRERINNAIFGLLLALLAYGASHFEGMLWFAFKIHGVTAGSLLGVFLLGLLTKRPANRANLIAMVASALCMAVLLVLSEKKIIPIGWSWLILFGTALTFGLGYLLGPLLQKRSYSPS